MRLLKYYFRYITVYLFKFRFFLFLSITLGIVFFLTLSVYLRISNNNKKVIGITGKYHTDSLPYDIQNEISSGLTMIDAQKNPRPAIAKSWETPDNGKTWIFKINTQLKWHDNSEVNSRNISYEFSDVTTETPDDETIIFKINNVFSPFPSVVSKPAFKKGLIGIGNWVVKDVTLSGSYVQEIVLKNKENENIYRFFPTTESTKTAFKLGKVDIIQGLLDPSPFDKWNTTNVVSRIENNQVVTIFFNTKSTILSEKEIRQALSYAINKKDLGQRAYSPISPNSWAYNPQVKSYDYDPEKSKKTISDSIDERKSEIKINLISSPALLPIAEKIKTNWEEAGVVVNLLISSIIPTDYDAYLTIYDIPTDPDQYSLWHSSQTDSNISKYSNPRIDKLLEDGRSTTNLEDRKKIYFDFQRFLLEDVPACFLIHPHYYDVIRK